ncbi:hypothetical protein EDD22DRAFT_955755 [Suillus occidentalis]|nr:hypothetical protein EDD22DRAFT_955755 [Suillus occidentalis]
MAGRLRLPLRASASRSRQAPEKPLEFKFWPYLRTRPRLRGLASAQGISDAAPSTASLRPSHIAPSKYDDKKDIHQQIFGEAQRKMAAHDALVLAANDHDDVYGNQWGAENVTVFYKSFTVPPSADIMSNCKKNARAVTHVGYSLRPAIWSEYSEPQYQIDMVADLINNPSFPFKYIFGNDLANPQDDEVYAFEHRVISTIVINTILKLGYVDYIEELDDLFCTGAAAVECVLLELASAKDGVSIDFGVSNFKRRFTILKEYIENHIKTNPELLRRWEEFKNCIHARLREIVAAY